MVAGINLEAIFWSLPPGEQNLFPVWPIYRRITVLTSLD
jgi:hypothetical protein